MAVHQVAGAVGDRAQGLDRRQPVGPAGVDHTGFDLVVDARDPHHEELIEVGPEDRQELRAFEQRHLAVFGQLQHALVEIEPRDLTVRVGQRARDRRVRDDRGYGDSRHRSFTAWMFMI